MDISYKRFNLKKEKPGRIQTKSSTMASKSGAREEWSFKTHFVGIIFGIAATIWLWMRFSGAPSFVIFGLSIIALYTCSSVYHYYNGPEDILIRLRKLDHSMIYVLIAGTYTPVLANILPMPKGAIFLAVMWIVAAAGIIIKVAWLDAPRLLYTSMYIFMGWSILVEPSALGLMDPRCLGFLIAGGVSYTIGAVMYILKKPDITEEFGFHELFHCFILLGTIFHFIGIAFFI